MLPPSPPEAGKTPIFALIVMICELSDVAIVSSCPVRRISTLYAPRTLGIDFGNARQSLELLRCWLVVGIGLGV